MRVKLFVSVLCLTGVFFAGCENKEKTMTGSTGQETQKVESFSSSVPSILSGKVLSTGGKGNADTLNDKPLTNIKVSKGDRFALAGWAIEDKTKSIPATVIIQLASIPPKDSYYAIATRDNNYKRPDVVKFFNEAAYEVSGYRLIADIKSVTPGQYSIKIIQLVDNNPVICETGKNIQVE